MPKEIFRLTMHPASEGDALMLTWGDATKPRNALIDLGRTKNYKALRPNLKEVAELELIAITHIDADHIEGAVSLFNEQTLPFKAKHVWFNAFGQLKAAKKRFNGRVELGVAQAEKVTLGIVRSGWLWNAHFASGIVSVDSPEATEPIVFDGGLKLTLLSPSDMKLKELIPTWEEELKKAGLLTIDSDEVEVALARGRVSLGGNGPDVEELAAVKFKEDSTKPNGSSIAFIAEFGGKRVLMGADSHPGMIEEKLRALGASETNRYRLDCLKVSHHGSKANTSPELLRIIDCTRFAISTDGSHHGHPDAEAIARILKADPERKKTLIFNFRQGKTVLWNDVHLMNQWKYECIFPCVGKEGIEFEI